MHPQQAVGKLKCETFLKADQGLWREHGRWPMVKREPCADPAEKKLAIIDLGPDLAKSLAAKNGVLGGIAPE